MQFVRPRARPLWMAAAELERAALIGWELSVVFVIVSSRTRLEELYCQEAVEKEGLPVLGG